MNEFYKESIYEIIAIFMYIFMNKAVQYILLKMIFISTIFFDEFTKSEENEV